MVESVEVAGATSVDVLPMPLALLVTSKAEDGGMSAAWTNRQLAPKWQTCLRHQWLQCESGFVREASSSGARVRKQRSGRTGTIAVESGTATGTPVVEVLLPPPSAPDGDAASIVPYVGYVSRGTGTVGAKCGRSVRALGFSRACARRHAGNALQLSPPEARNDGHSSTSPVAGSRAVSGSVTTSARSTTKITCGRDAIAQCKRAAAAPVRRPLAAAGGEELPVVSGRGAVSVVVGGGRGRRAPSRCSWSECCW
mmetsp:Transcript_34018/g.105016  ORF Transcript_34018/g.105016 Transcript_34018/m.105016 type:complete len:254 (-) Transcript_34018:768-1529(-)